MACSNQDHCRCPQAAGTKPLDTSFEAKTIQLIIPAVLHGDDPIHTVITFDSEESYKVRCARCAWWMVCMVSRMVAAVTASEQRLTPVQKKAWNMEYANTVVDSALRVLFICVQEYLRSVQCGGLILLDEHEPKLVVNNFAQLVPDRIYTHSLSSKEAFARLLGEACHLQQSREDEFARALTDYAQHAEPDQVSVSGGWIEHRVIDNGSRDMQHKL